MLAAIAATCAVPLATGEVEELDRILAGLSAAGEWGRLELIEVAVLDLDGRIAAHSDPRRFGQRMRDDFTDRARATDAPITAVAAGPGGRTLRLGLPVVSGLRWGTATATLDLDEVDRWVARGQHTALLWAAATAAFIGALLSLLLANQVLRPLQELTAAVARLAEGDLAARVGEGRRGPEFTLLAGVFDGLARQVEESTRRLEAQVQERTRALEEANAELEELASTDGLTGLANHRAFHERLKDEVARARRTGAPLALIMLDVDHFKAFNDAHGHPRGDEVLAGVGGAIQQRLRSTDLAARYGGEEFAVLLPATEPDAALRVAEELVAAVRDAAFPGRESQPGGRVTASAGVAGWRGPDEDGTALLARADAALYRAKHTGRDRVVGEEPR